MKKIYLIISLLTTVSFSFAQYDTTYFETTTAANAATWLKDLKLSQDTGRIGFYQGSMGPLAYGNDITYVVDTTSISYLYSDSTLFAKALNSASSKMKNYFIWARQLNGYMMRCPESFCWGTIEPDSGTYYFQLHDTIMKYAGQNNIHVMGTIDTKNDFGMACNDSNTNCPIFGGGKPMYWVNEGRTGAICDEDTSTYINFLTKTVERYDGDGIDDMPGLVNPILYWEFLNEPWYTGCTNYTASEYIRDHQITYTAIKSVCSDCKVINGAWDHEPDSMYWDSIFTYCKDYIDVANIHVNEPRSDVFNYDNDMGIQMRMLERKRDSLNTNWNTWVTEWGLYKGTHIGQFSGKALPYVTEEEQAARYAKFYAWGLSQDISMYFYDQSGDSTSGVGSSALFEKPSGSQRFMKLSAYTLKLLEYKFRTIDSASAESFSTDSAFQEGNIRIWKDGKPTEVLWGLDSLPWYIQGSRIVTDIYGNIDTMEASLIPLPLSSNPIIIEDMPVTSSTISSEPVIFKLFPNPASNRLYIQLGHPQSNYTVRIYNSLLELVMEEDNAKSELDISTLRPGIYFVEINQDGRYGFNKLIVKASN